MKIIVHSSRAVMPDYGGSSPPARTETVALSVFDKVTFDQYVSGIYFFHPPVPPNAVLEAGFAKALAAYRVWAGRLGTDAATGDPAILLNDAGALFVEATADVALSSVMPLDPTPEVTSLHPSRRNVLEPLRVQVTRFACGSVVVGTTEHHRVGDGRTIVQFMVAWGKATRGLAVDDNPVPVLDRARVFAPRGPPRVVFEHRGVEFKPRGRHMACGGGNVGGGDEVVIHRVHFSREWASAGAPAPYSTLRCVVAHLWRCITTARGLDGRQATAARVAVDGRSRMSNPRVPEGYAGNVVLWATPTTTAGELAAMHLRHAAQLVSDAVARMDDGYFRSFVDFSSSGAVEEERLVPTSDAAKMVLSPDIEVYSMVGFRFGDVNFGGGAAFFHMRSYVAEEGLVFILPSLSGDGSIYAYVNLFRRDMDMFKKCCYSLVAAEARL